MKFLRAALIVVFALHLSACSSIFPPPPPTDKLQLTPASFSDLPGWNDDRTSEVMPALRNSCAVISRKSNDSKMGIAGSAKDWQSFCAELKNRAAANDADTRAFIETRLRPYAAHSPAGSLFTGYYEAELNGSLQKEGKYQIPLWQKPSDLITADLGEFKPELKGQKVAGKIVKQKLKPYDDRALISQNSLETRAQPLIWVDDPVSAFFLEIQGSGRVNLPDGSIVRVGYDAQNGHPFVPIGRVLADEGEIEKPVTMQKIRAWLKAHPNKSTSMMNRNPSVVFFRKSDKDGAVGAQGAVLTPMRSMAVDPRFIPLGVPLWLDINDDGNGTAIRRLVIAQDTGGAIKGAVRGDLFCGNGSAAEALAGGLQSNGRYYILLPKAVSVNGAN